MSPEYAPNYSDEPDVGTIYQVAINGVGYMLANREGQQGDYQRVTIPLVPQRLATSETPFAEAVERYTFSAFADWRNGRGQKRRSEVDADPAQFFESLGVDVFNRDGLQLVKAASVAAPLTSAVTNMVVIDDRLYFFEGAALKRIDTPGGTVTTVLTAGSVPKGMTDDGAEWYYSLDSTTIQHGSTSGSTFATLAGKNIGPLGWGGNRLLAAYGDSSGVYDTFTSIGPDGAEEVPDGRITLPTGWTIQAFTSGQGYVFFAANGPGGLDAWRSVIYAWDLTTYTPYVVDEIEGEAIVDLNFFQGQMLIRTRRQHEDGASFGIYRAAVQEDTGALTRFLIFEEETDDPQDDYAVVAGPSFATSGPLAFFAWPGNSIVAVDLETGGTARYWGLGSTSVAGPIMWQGQPTWGDGTIDLFRVDDEEFASSGWVQTSLVDGVSVLDKLWDKVRLQAEPLPANTSVAVEYTTDAWDNTVSVAAAALAATDTDSVADLAIGSKHLGLKLTLASSNNASTPVLQLAQIQYHAAGLADEVLVLPIDCGDWLKGANGAPLATNGHGTGAARAAALQAMVNSRVQVQDIDWRLTDTTEVFEVEQVGIDKKMVRGAHQGENVIRMVAIVQLRRGQA